MNVGKGPSRPVRAEALADLALARQASSRGDMGNLLRRLVAESVEQFFGQPLAANGEPPRRGPRRGRSYLEPPGRRINPDVAPSSASAMSGVMQAVHSSDVEGAL